jgi:putative inorganic carbon (HCO3(-)) transporter
MSPRERFLLLARKITEWALYVLIFSLPFSKTAVEICAITMIISWGLRKAVGGREYLKLDRTGLNLPIIVFYLIAFLSIFWSTHTEISISAFWRKLSEYIALFIIVAETANDKRIIKNIVYAISFSAAIVCLDGIYQKFSGHDIIRHYPLHSLERITGPFRFPNEMSGWLLVVFFITIPLAIYTRQAAGRAWNIALLSLLSYVAFYGMTRGAFAAFVPALGIMLVAMGGRKAAIIFLAGLAVFIIAMVLLPKARESIYVLKFFSGSSTEHRTKVLAAGWQMFMEKPFTGQGLNTFMANYGRFRQAGDAGVWYAHNTYLQVAAEMGIFGLAAFLWIIVKAAIIFIKTFRRVNDAFLRPLYLGLFCGLAGFLFLSALDVTHFSLRLAVLFYVSLGLLMAVKNVGLRDGKI